MKIYFTRHAIQRLYERSISKNDIREAVENGEVIKEYNDDKPFPSRLLLYACSKRNLHVVYSIEPGSIEEKCIIITVYEPSPMEWADDFRTRREPE